MNYSNKTYIIGTIVLSLALVFIVGIAQPSTASACGYGGCQDYYPPVIVPVYQAQTPPLQVQCYPQPLTIQAGDSATWVSNVYGGTGSYSYTWSGSDGLSGSGPSISRAYYTSGNESANLTVTSGNQTKSASCSGSVTVYGNNNNYYPPVNNPPVYNPPVYNPPVYYPPTNYYNNLQVSCVPNASYTNVGTVVTWTASVNISGQYTTYGNYYAGGYSYSWSGTDSLFGYGQTISMAYNTPGVKTAIVTVTYNGQTVTQSCGSQVNVTGYGYQTGYYNNTYVNNTSVSNNNSGLDIGCYADPANATINQPITWSVEVTGGAAPYTYSWSGTDGLSGTGSTVIKYYDTNGQKSAIVSVTSADGKTGTRACTNSLAVGRPAGSNIARTTTNTTVTSATTNQSNNGQSAAALFSLQNIPWGWVAILVILVLFATVLYLIFNRPKI